MLDPETRTKPSNQPPPHEHNKPPRHQPESTESKQFYITDTNIPQTRKTRPKNESPTAGKQPTTTTTNQQKVCPINLPPGEGDQTGQNNPQ